MGMEKSKEERDWTKGVEREEGGRKRMGMVKSKEERDRAKGE